MRSAALLVFLLLTVPHPYPATHGATSNAKPCTTLFDGTPRFAPTFPPTFRHEVGPPLTRPLPADPLKVAEALCDPVAAGLQVGVGLGRRRVGQQDPGVPVRPGMRITRLRDRGCRLKALVVLLADGDKDSQKRDIRRVLELARGLSVGGRGHGKGGDWVGPAAHLETKEDMVAYPNIALAEGDLSLLMATPGDSPAPGE